MSALWNQLPMHFSKSPFKSSKPLAVITSWALNSIYLSCLLAIHQILDSCPVSKDSLNHKGLDVLLVEMEVCLLKPALFAERTRGKWPIPASTSEWLHQGFWWSKTGPAFSPIQIFVLKHSSAVAHIKATMGEGENFLDIMLCDWLETRRRERERDYGLPIGRANVKVYSLLPTQEEKPFKAKSFVPKSEEQMESVSIFLKNFYFVRSCTK